jgi:hypothetical protein
LRIIFQILSNNKIGNELSFQTVERDLKLTIEDLEEVLFEADELNLFKLVIDYEKNIIRVRYVRKLSYGKKDVEEMKSKISGLRDRMKGFIKKIDLLIASE